MSERADVQESIRGWLTARPLSFNAPYGVITSLKKLDRGAVRRVTFGVARRLDATIYIWSPTSITVQAAGPLADEVEGRYESMEQLWEQLGAIVREDER